MMIEHENQTVRTISWAEVFPWLRLVRVFRIAISPSALVLGALGVLLTIILWWMIGSLCGVNFLANAWGENSPECPWQAVTSVVPSQPMLSVAECKANCVRPAKWNNPIVRPWLLLSQPALEGVRQTGLPLNKIMAILLSGLTSVAIWAFFGAAICRIAAVQLAAEERVGLMTALRYACRKWPAYCAAPLLPVLAILLAALPVLVLGWIMSANMGVLLGGLLWPLALLAGVVMTVLLAGLLFGWPLMWATISTEGTDSFDALSRSYSYTFQRPLNYLFYAAVAAVIGWLGWILVVNFAAAVVWMSYWAAGWGCGSEHLNLITAGGDGLTGLGAVGSVLVRFWADAVKLLAVGYVFSYFWSASAGIYLLLRRDVDATETDEVELDADLSDQTFTLPKITTDKDGSPVIEDPEDDKEAE